jgi:hypothetical protein
LYWTVAGQLQSPVPDTKLSTCGAQQSVTPALCQLVEPPVVSHAQVMVLLLSEARAIVSVALIRPHTPGSVPAYVKTQYVGFCDAGQSSGPPPYVPASDAQLVQDPLATVPTVMMKPAGVPLGMTGQPHRVLGMGPSSKRP